MKQIEIHYADDWAALYVDGTLATIGDTHVAEEQALSMLGVKFVYDDAFMRGQDQRDGVAPTVAEVAAYRERRERRKAEVARLRAEAARLLAKAEAHEKEEGG